jgi:hypothetical protein
MLRPIGEQLDHAQSSFGFTIGSSKFARRCMPYGRATSATRRAALNRESPIRQSMPAGHDLDLGKTQSDRHQSA